MTTGFRGARAMLEAGGRRAIEQDHADAIARKARRVRAAQEGIAEVKEDLGNAGLIINDNVPPTVPTNIAITPYAHAVDIYWDEPLLEQFVDRARVTVTPQGESARTVNLPRLGGTITNLSNKPHTFVIRFVDRWDLIGAASAPLSATPTLTVAESIDLAELALLGRLQGLLPNANLAQIGDPAKFAAGIVKNLALAAGANANLFQWDEATYENWASGQVWSTAQLGFNTAFSAGTGSASVVTTRTWKWLRVVFDNNAGSPTNFFPRSTWSNRGLLVGGSSYIVSVLAKYVSGTAGAGVAARLRIEAADDVNGTNNAVVTNGDTFTLPLDGSPVRLYNKFAFDSGKFYRFALRLEDTGTVKTIDITQWQLERVDAAQSEPGKWSAPVTSFGVMSGRMLGVMDAAIVNAVIGAAAIGTARINDLAVDKITGGTFTGGNFIVAGAGKLKAGQVTLDSGGVTMVASTEFSEPAAQRDTKIGAQGDWAAMGFYNDPTTNTGGFRGVVHRADGNGNRRGSVDLQATVNGNLSGSGTAKVEVTSREAADGGPYIAIQGDLSLNQGYDLKLRSSDGHQWSIRVSNAGNLVVV